jgi:hypothetical protein
MQLSTGICGVVSVACTGFVQHLPLCLHRVSATPRHSHVQPARHAGPDYAKTATMHNAQAFGQVCGLSERRCSCLHRVCAKLAAGYTWTRPQADNHVQSPQQVCELMACSCNYLQTSVLLLPAQGLMLHAQGWRSTCCSACTGFVQRLYMYTANYTLHGLQDPPE